MRDGPPVWVRVVGQALSRLVARFPRTWPLLRGPVRRFFDRVAPEWDRRTADPGRLAPLDAALELIDGVPSSILDLGTGTGSAAVHLAERFSGAQIVGVDLSPRMVELAQARVPATLVDRIRFEAADATALPFTDDAFDLVVQVSVPAFFAETTRVLAPGGHLVVVSSIGAATPFHTPHSALRRGFARHGVEEHGSGEAGRGLYWLGRRT